MNKSKSNHPSSGRRVALASISTALLLGGCSISASAGSNTAADANASSRASSSSNGGSRAEARSRSGTNVEGSSSARASGKASGKFSGSSKTVFTTKTRVTGVGRAKTEDHFKGTILVGGGKGKASASAGVKTGGSAHADGKGSGKAEDGTSGKGSTGGKGSAHGDGSTKAEGTGSTKTGGKGASNAEKGSSGKGEPKPSKDSSKPEKSDSKPDKDNFKPKKDPSNPDNTPKADAKPKGNSKPEKDHTKPGKTPGKGDPKPGEDEGTPTEEPVVVIDPPKAPPENVFGYETPVRGCFEGIVYPIASTSLGLPTNWNALTAVSVVYACEWDIPTRKWDAGFPGVEDRFEWFAIQYSGSFSIQTAGKWKFRISSDDGAKLFIDGKLIVDNDGVHPPKEQEVEVQLSAGDHEMVLEYFQGPRYHINLQLFATPPGGVEGVFSVR